MVVQTGGSDATSGILSPFVNVLFSERSKYERPNEGAGAGAAAGAAAANHSKILWCRDHHLLTKDQQKQQINGHVWKLIMDICHDFFSGMDKDKKQEFLDEAMEAAEKIDQDQVDTPLTEAFKEWQSSPFPVNAGGTKFANKERHALFAILSMIPLDELKLMLSSFQDIGGVFRKRDRASLTPKEMLQIDEKCSGTLKRSYDMSHGKQLIIVMEASKWSIRNLINAGYLNLTYTDTTTDTTTGTWSGYPPPGHPAASNPNGWIDRKSLACLFDPATRKGHGSVEHYLWHIISEKYPDLNTPPNEEDFYNVCKDILKSSFQLFLDVFVNPLTGGAYIIEEMIIKSSISAGEGDDNVVFVKINDQWYIHKLGSNSISKTTSNGTDEERDYSVNNLPQNGNGELLIPNEGKTIDKCLPLKSFFKKLGVDTKFEIIFNNSYKSFGDWVQVVYLKKLNIYVNSKYELDVILAITSNDKYVLLDALCNFLIIYVTAVNVRAFALMESEEGEGEQEEEEEGDGGSQSKSGGGSTSGAPTMHMVGASIHKEIYDPVVYTRMFREYDLIIDPPIWPVEQLKVNESDSVYSFISKFKEYLEKKYEEYLDERYGYNPEEGMGDGYKAEDEPPVYLEILKKIIKKIKDGAKVVNPLTGVIYTEEEIDGFTEGKIHDYIENLNLSGVKDVDKENQKLFLTELNRFCNALRAAFDKDLLKNMETHFNRSKEIGDNIGNDGAFLEDLKKSLFPSDNDDEPPVSISVSLTQILNHFKGLTTQCHELYKLNINELIKKPTQSMKDVLIDDYEFSEGLHKNFKKKTEDFLDLHEAIKDKTEVQVLYTKDQLHLIYKNAIESIKEHAEGEITYIRKGVTGRKSRRLDGRREANMIGRIESVEKVREKSKETANVKFETIKGMMNDIMEDFGLPSPFSATPLPQQPVDNSVPILPPPTPSPPSGGGNNITQSRKMPKTTGGESKKTRKRNRSSENKRTDDNVELLKLKKKEKKEINEKLTQLRKLQNIRINWRATRVPVNHDEAIRYLDSVIFKEYAILFRMHDENGQDPEEEKILGERKPINNTSAFSPGNINQNDEPEAEQDSFEVETYKVVEALHYTNEIVNFILQEFVEYLEKFYLEQIEYLDVMISYYTPVPAHITKKPFTLSQPPTMKVDPKPSQVSQHPVAPDPMNGDYLENHKHLIPRGARTRPRRVLFPIPLLQTTPMELDPESSQLASKRVFTLPYDRSAIAPHHRDNSLRHSAAVRYGGRLRKSRKKSKKQLQHSRKVNKRYSIKKNIKSKKINRKNKTRKK